MGPNGSGIGPTCLYDVARSSTSGMPWNMLGSLRVCTTGEGSLQAGQWVHQIAQDLRAGKVHDVIAGLKRLRPKTPELTESLQALIRYYSENAGRMHYDEYLRLGYGIGSGAGRAHISKWG